MKKAFTLIELLVYIAILGFIIVVAGRAFSDATGMRVRSQNMLASAEEAGRISALLKEDISQMGAKSWGASSASSYIFVESVYQNAAATNGDSSSFVLGADGSYDSLSFRKLIYDDGGNCLAAVKVKWYVENSNLMRKCDFINSTNNQCANPSSLDECPADPVEMASGITGFRIYPSIPGNPGAATFAEFPAAPGEYRLIYRNNVTQTNSLPIASPDNGIVTLSGFVNNASATDNNRTEAFLAAGTASGSTALSNCKTFNFVKGEEYNIYFEMQRPSSSSSACEYYNCMDNFQPGKDHLAIGFRRTNGTALNIANPPPDFLFYPPQAESANQAGKTQRSFDFSFPVDVTNACIAITAAFYSPLVYEGSLLFKNFKVTKKTDRVYHFDTSSVSTTSTLPGIDAKPLVKAFQLVLGVEKGNAKPETTLVVTTIPVPNNGIKQGGSI
jgi:type II secretory pathway pseudopilin PulG